MTCYAAACGSSAATAGPTTSGPAGSITCWPAGATSTCLCSTPRCTPTPAGRRRRRPRWAPSPSSPRRARRCRRRTWPCRRSRTAACTSPGSRRARPAVPRGGQRLLAADPLRPGGPRRRRQPVPARLAAPADAAGRLHPQGTALPRARQHRPGRGRAARRAGPAGGGPALGHLRGDGDPRPGAVPAGRSKRQSRADGRGHARHLGGTPMTDLATRYLGLELRNPLVASASPLSNSADGVRRLADGGAAAVVMYSLFEEQLRQAAARDAAAAEAGTESFAESLSYFAAAAGGDGGPGRYLSLLERAAAAVDVPVIASLNGSTTGGWTDYASALQDAGAAAIELN